jgi:hypothetical protein
MNFSSWKSCLSAYYSREITTAHVDAVLETFKGLTPKPDTYSNFLLFDSSA